MPAAQATQCTAAMGGRWPEIWAQSPPPFSLTQRLLVVEPIIRAGGAIERGLKRPAQVARGDLGRRAGDETFDLGCHDDTDGHRKLLGGTSMTQVPRAGPWS